MMAVNDLAGGTFPQRPLGAASLQDLPEKWADYQLDLIRKHGMPKLGRWVYCKYCYQKVRPELDFLQGLVKCSKCGAGLAQLDKVIEAGSYQKWDEKIGLDFARMTRYLDELRQGTKEADGMDEYGPVPYICPACKKRTITVYSPQGDFCAECARPDF